MKKIFLSVLLALTVLLVTGCGKEIDFNKTSHITCSKIEDKQEEKTSSTITLAYDKNEVVTDFKIETDITYKTTMTKEAAEITAKTMKLIAKVLGVNAKTETSDNRVYFGFTGNIKKLKSLMEHIDTDYKEKEFTNNTKSDALKGLTKDGFTCKDFKK